MKPRLATMLIVAGLACGTAEATEPNESFAEATILAPGVLSVADSLTRPGPPPDTLLGIRGLFGDINETNDDDSPVGDGHASGLFEVATNSGSIDFAVTGVGDGSFIGDHFQVGDYEVFVRAYDLFGDPVDFFSETRRLEPGVVDEFSYADANWIGGTYDVYIDNLVELSDVDFYTFTGLTPGAEFTARTLDPGAFGVDTLLGWFNSAGGLLDSDNNGGGGLLSRIDGNVPANGKLTFAVTGLGDNAFVGNHNELGDYELLIELAGSLPGDYNENHVVDAADYTVWRDHLDSGTALPNDDTAGVGSDDYTRWKSHFGQTAGSGSSNPQFAIPGTPWVLQSDAAVPEPATTSLVCLGMANWLTLLRRR